MESVSKKILVVDDDANMLRVLTAHIRREGYDVIEARNGLEAVVRLQCEPFAAVITDQRMPRMDGLGLLAHCIENQPGLPVILLTAHGTIETAVQAIKKGAFDYITKPFDENELLHIIQKAVQLSAKNLYEPRIASSEFSQYGMIGRAPAMKKVFQKTDKVADSPSTVLIFGETGTGKELIARALHQRSGRNKKPFIVVNCGAIPDSLVESELFGHERGAFTGAVTSKPGRFELAHQGTLFLDEIGELKKELQAKLLRVLQSQTFERVGGVKTIQVDVRVVAASNRDLAEEVQRGNFREDLFYRLNVVRLKIPALRDRAEDIPALVRYFMERFNKKLKKAVDHISEDVMEKLRVHRFPGNIRELENLIEGAVLMADGDTLRSEDFPEEIIPSSEAREADSFKSASKEATSRAERTLILKALEDTGGNVTHAAKQLGMSRRGLQLKMKDYHLRSGFPE